jgi:hypothetical protein
MGVYVNERICMSEQTNSEKLSFVLEQSVEYNIQIDRQSLGAMREDPSMATDMLYAIGLDMKQATNVVDLLISRESSTTHNDAFARVNTQGHTSPIMEGTEIFTNTQSRSTSQNLPMPSFIKRLFCCCNLQ